MTDELIGGLIYMSLIYFILFYFIFKGFSFRFIIMLIFDFCNDLFCLISISIFQT